MLVHPDDLAGRDDRDVRREVAGDAPDDRLVADQDDLVLGMGPGVIDRAGDDLGRTMIAAHRVDRDADPGGVAGRRLGVGLRSPRQRAASSAAGRA